MIGKQKNALNETIGEIKYEPRETRHVLKIVHAPIRGRVLRVLLMPPWPDCA
jgi:hypothetical protein